MAKIAKKLVKEIEALPDTEKLRIVDTILTELDKPDPVIDRIWANESRKRWAAYKAERAHTISYDALMDKHRSS